MKVFILGAGFSNEAGYPLASGLLPAVERYWQGSRVNDEAVRWQAFKNWRVKQIRRGRGIKDIVANGNPEYLLTYLDIACAACESTDSAAWTDAVLAERCGDPDAEMLGRRASKCTGRLEPERTHRRTLQEAVIWLFRHQHHYDLGKEDLWAEGKVMGFFRDDVTAGDTIITFNYDAVAERCLLALRKWHPSDGYGFRLQLASRSQEVAVCEGSSVRILKLHGSVGWRKGRHQHDGSVMLETEFTCDLGLYSICDPKAQYNERARSDEFLVFPSFVKVIDHPVLAGIWADAASALAEATEVVIIGYSLPQADSAAISLLAANLSRRDCPVTVIDPQPGSLVLERYEPVIGRPVDHKQMTLSQWMETRR